MKNTSPITLDPLRWIGGTAALLLAMALLANCGDPAESLNPSGSTCGVLNTVQANAGGTISGNTSTGGLSDYSFEAGASGEVDIQPPSASPCGDEIAQRLQGLCAVCEQNGGAACESLAKDLFNPANGTFPEACAACGDSVCSPGESAVDAPGKITCALDCTGGTSCGDGTCAALENPQTCPQDCETACGDGTCDGDESNATCPEDCESACGDGTCDSGEQGLDPQAPNYCRVDCCQAVSCGDGICSESCENVGSCAQDCQKCGDDICSDASTGGSESLGSCPRDCSVCGDGVCSRNEVIANPNAEAGERLCVVDCCATQAVCGDGTCSPGCETAESCAQDCN